MNGNQTKHFLLYYKETITRKWNNDAIEDYKGTVKYTFGEMAEQMARLGILFKNAGIKKGDKIALCSPNSTNWAVTFLAVAAYEGVGVSIMANFATETIEGLVNHSDSRILFAAQNVQNQVNPANMPNLEGIVSLDNFDMVYGTEQFKKAMNNWDADFKAAYPNGFSKEDLNYNTDNLDQLALINYTSGTTSSPKGVMLSYRSISSNCQFAIDVIPIPEGGKLLELLPMAHMFGLMFEFIYTLAGGAHVVVLTKAPAPQILMQAFQDVKPFMVLSVPLIIEKIFKGKIFPAIKKPAIKILWHIPIIGGLIKKKVYTQLQQAFGGNLERLIIGGAALNKEVERCLRDIKFPYCVGYGMTEAGPLIAYTDYKTYKMYSCGRSCDRMEAKIDSSNQQKVVGEILCKGDNVMLGYYKNEEATKATFTADGWLKTGDLGIIDKNGNIFIRGRNKNMILGPSGQNIYPEELEDKLNNLEGVIESIVVERDGKLVGLVYPDLTVAEKLGISTDELMKQNIQKLNKVVPSFCHLSKIELMKEEFAKTPKNSIKRFMYK